MYKTTLTLLAILLGGCALTSATVVQEVPTYHPTMPAAISACPVTWKVIEVDGQAMVAISYNDNVTAAICNKDVGRYISQLLTVTCQYRQELKESICIGN